MSEDDSGVEVAEPLSVNSEVVLAATGRRRSRFQLHMEVPMLCMFFAVSLSGAVINNMLLERACRLTLGYNETICSRLQRSGALDEKLEKRAQAVITLVLMAKGVLEGVFPAVLSLFLGVWSNKHGRKPLFTWPLFGYALTSILVAGYSLVGSLSPWWFVLTSLPYSLGGGGSTLFTGAFCHCADITNDSNRSFRLTILESSVLVGSILGSLASPYTQAALGTPLLLLFTACLCVAAYVFANLCVEESVAGAVPGGLRSVLDMSLVKKMLKTCFKRRPNYERAVIFLLVVANSFGIFIMYGLFNIDYLYARNKLSWQLEQYSIFSAVNTALMVVGMLAGVGVLQKTCKVGDTVLTLVSIASSMAEMLCNALATAANSWLMYLGSCVSLLRGLKCPLIRSVLSKRVAADDVAKVFALMSALEAILPVFSPILYDTLYKYTLKTMPEAVYLMTVGFYAVCFVMISVAHYLIASYPMQTYSTLNS